MFAKDVLDDRWDRLALENSAIVRPAEKPDPGAHCRRVDMEFAMPSLASHVGYVAIEVAMPIVR
jgi:hypothetical protein